MNIVDFMSEFDDCIPYQVIVNVGGSKKNDIVKNKEYISRDNLKGKMVPFYEPNFGKLETKYVPANEVSLPIDIKVEGEGNVFFDGGYKIGLVKKNPITKTGKDSTEHIIRILNSENRQTGCIQLELNAAGDIVRKYCSYCNPDFTHEIVHSVDIDFKYQNLNQLDKMIHNGRTTYTKKDYELGTETEVTIYHVEGSTTGLEIIKRKTNNPDTYYHFARSEAKSYQDVVSNYHRESLETATIREALIDFRKERDFYESIKDDNNYLSHYCPPYGIEYYQDEKNDLMYGFVGEYTGNTLIKTEDKQAIIIRTSDLEFNYYTEIDMTGIKIFEHGDCDIWFSNDAIDRIRSASKKPKFKTQIQNKVECLVPQDGETCTEEELESFQKFQSDYLEPFEEINKVKVSKLLQKKK